MAPATLITSLHTQPSYGVTSVRASLEARPDPTARGQVAFTEGLNGMELPRGL